MKVSNFFINTLKNFSSKKHEISYSLMVRSGIIRKISSGIYTYLPIGLRSIKKIENVIRKEMNKSGAIELLMPIIQPKKIWIQSGRLKKYGDELISFNDRKNRTFILSPTNEEMIIEIMKNQIKSYKQMPKIFYQIQTKFRDEIRPQFGITRTKEFLMKDSYSFDLDLNNLKKTYKKIYKTYSNILNKLKLNFHIVIAENGLIGGISSHEFHVIPNIKNNYIQYEKDKLIKNSSKTELTHKLYKKNKIYTPIKETCKNISNYLKIPITNIIKYIVLSSKNKDLKTIIWFLMICGNDEFDYSKIKKILGLSKYCLANDKKKNKWFGSTNFLGPLNTKKKIKTIIDYKITNINNFVIGANEVNFHITNINIKDLYKPIILNICKNNFTNEKNKHQSIEIGHIFKLGEEYTKKMNFFYSNKLGINKPVQMGCYGLGITRILSSIIEQNHDKYGIIWPKIVAPFDIVLCPIGYHNSIKVKNETNKLYKKFIKNNFDIIFDDRNKHPGSMFIDWELIGIPYILIISENLLNIKKIEFYNRKKMTKTLLSIDNIIQIMLNKIKIKL